MAYGRVISRGRFLATKVCMLAIQNGVQMLQIFPYATNPLGRTSLDTLRKSAYGGEGGKRGKGGLKNQQTKNSLKPSRVISLGECNKVQWPGLSYPLKKARYNLDWLSGAELGAKELKSNTKNESENQIVLRDLEGDMKVTRKVSEQNWSERGWSGGIWGGRYVGCPEAPDGTPLTDFKSCVIEMKRVANQTAQGRKKSLSALVVVGNCNGVAGYAIGKSSDIRGAIRKAKNKAVNCLRVFQRCENHTTYHDIKVKSRGTTILFEKKVKGHGLRCQRAIKAVCELVGLRDLRAKIIGRSNPQNIMIATFKGLTAQETHQDLANKSGMIVVEYRRECYDRPVVVAVPDKYSKQQDNPVNN